MAEMKIGEFGPIYSQFKGKPKQAIKHLKKVRKGEALKVFYRDEIGFVDLVWGENDPKSNKGFGLKHIIEKHSKEIARLGFEVEDFLIFSWVMTSVAIGTFFSDNAVLVAVTTYSSRTYFSKSF